jgi:hypothetical protein
MGKDIVNIPSILAYLLELDPYIHLEDISVRAKIPTIRNNELVDLLHAILRGQISLDLMPNMLGQAFGLDDAKAKELSVDLAGYRLLTFSAFLPDVEKKIVEWGGKISDYPDFRISLEQEMTDSAATKILARHDITLPPELLSRFEYIVKGYIKKDRTEEATMTFLKRRANIGGLGMSEGAAKNLLAELKTEQEAIASIQEEADHPAVTQAFKEEKDKKVDGEVHAIENEITHDAAAILKADAREEKLEVLGPPSRKGLSMHAEGKITAPPAAVANKNLPVKTVTKALTKEVPVISGRKVNEKREVRSSKFEVGSSGQEARPAKGKSGSVGKPAKRKSTISTSSKNDSTKPQADSTPSTDWQPTGDERVQKALLPVADFFKSKKIAQKAFDEVVNAHLRGLRDPLRTELHLKDKLGFSKAEIAQVMPGLEKARALAQGYKDQPPQISSVKKPVSQEEQHAKQEVELLNKRHASLTRNIADDSAESIAPTARVSAARSKGEELDLQASKVDEARVAAAKKSSRPKKAKAKLSKPSAVPSKSDGKKLTDISYRQKLVGPVQELGGMTAADFRRISSDPNEGARRIMDKLALLESTSFEERVKGVKAWRQSPMNKLYIEMARQGLIKGASIQEIAAERRNAGEESLSPAEIQAVLKLNGQMKF